MTPEVALARVMTGSLQAPVLMSIELGMNHTLYVGTDLSLWLNGKRLCSLDSSDVEKLAEVVNRQTITGALTAMEGAQVDTLKQLRAEVARLTEVLQFAVNLPHVFADHLDDVTPPIVGPLSAGELSALHVWVAHQNATIWQRMQETEGVQ
jgi:hypothetical protein